MPTSLPKCVRAGKLRDREGQGGNYVFIGASSMARPLLCESKISSHFCPYIDPEKHNHPRKPRRHEFIFLKSLCSFQCTFVLLGHLSKKLR